MNSHLFPTVDRQNRGSIGEIIIRPFYGHPNGKKYFEISGNRFFESSGEYVLECETKHMVRVRRGSDLFQACCQELSKIGKLAREIPDLTPFLWTYNDNILFSTPPTTMNVGIEMLSKPLLQICLKMFEAHLKKE